MSRSRYYRLQAVTAVITGACIILIPLLFYIVNAPAGTVFNFLSLLTGLFVVTGLYLWQRARSVAFGLVASVVLFIGLAIIGARRRTLGNTSPLLVAFGAGLGGAALIWWGVELWSSVGGNS